MEQPSISLRPRETVGFVLRFLSWGWSSSLGAPTCQEQLVEVQRLQASGGAFAAICAHGAVVTWGDPRFGSDSSKARGVVSALGGSARLPLPTIDLLFGWIG